MIRRALALGLVLLVAAPVAAQYVPRAIQESDGSPSIPDFDVLELDQSTGLELVPLSGTRAKIRLKPTVTPTPTVSATPTATATATPPATLTAGPRPR